MIQSRCYEYLKNDTKKSLDILICEDAKEASQLKDVANYFERDVVVFPDLRAHYLDDLRSYREELSQLFDALRHYYALSSKPLVISPLKTLLFPLPKAELLQGIDIEFGSKIDLKSFKEQILQWGYTFVDIVQVEGEVSFRGDIFDIFIPSRENPFRISLFDDEIEEIKAFITESQRTVGEECEVLHLVPAFYSLDNDAFERISKEVEASESDSFVKDIASLGFWYLDDLAEDFLQEKKSVFIKPM
ncbi:MAG: transcription-repair coupling factor, partial [Campylobacterota bacterium]|nr:transcription-repair coupling factor [Campylobacterota bacterium]